MPGIVGLITKAPSESAKQQLLRMVGSICHDSSYVSGTWMDESLGIYVGWAARKNSFADGMPLQNERGDVSLIFSGEEFPAPGVIDRLKERGHSLQANRPDYLVHLYEEESAFPLSLNGRFHGLVVDQARKSAILFNDRYGMHRIYYHQSKEAFYFAAEAKAILAVRAELRATDAQGLGELVTCGCVLDNRTVFKGIQVVPPASAWKIKNGEVESKDLYFRPEEWEAQETLEPEAYYRELRDVFSRNLPRYFQAQQPIGLSLTGGLDTRMIMAWWKVAAGSIPCYTFRGMYHDCQDVVIARRVAEACHQSHQEIRVGEDFLSRFGSFAERTVYLTDGCADVGRSPVLYANEYAAKIAPIRMTGNYGSEVLRRMVAFKPARPMPGMFAPELEPHFRDASQSYDRLLEGHPVSFIAFRQVPWHHFGLLALEQTQLSPRSPYLDNDLVKVCYRAPTSSLVKSSVFFDNDYCLRLIAEGNPALSKIRSDRGLGGPNGAMGAITRTWLEITFRAEYEYDYGMRQSVAKVDHLLSAFHLERLFLGRHKYYHFRVWYRDALANYVKEILLDPKSLSRPYVNRKTLETIVNGHLNGGKNYTTAIHKMLSLELMHRQLLDG